MKSLINMSVPCLLFLFFTRSDYLVIGQTIVREPFCGPWHGRLTRASCDYDHAVALPYKLKQAPRAFMDTHSNDVVAALLSVSYFLCDVGVLDRQPPMSDVLIDKIYIMTDFDYRQYARDLVGQDAIDIDPNEQGRLAKYRGCGGG